MSKRRGEIQLRILLFEWVILLLLLPPPSPLSLKFANAAEGSVGCLYSNGLCDADTEWCYNDAAFGRCVYRHESGAADNLYRYKFKYEDLENLKEILQQLRELDFTWKDLYTQCVVQTQLYTIRTGQYDVDAEICDQMLKQKVAAAAADPIRLLRYGPGVGPGPGPALASNADAASRTGFVRNSAATATAAAAEGVVKYAPEDLHSNAIPRVESKQSAQHRPQLHRKPDYESELLNLLRLQSSELKSEVYKKNFKSTSSRYRGTPLYLPLHNRDKFKPVEQQFAHIQRSLDGEISQSNDDGDEDEQEQEQDEEDIQPDVYDQLLALQKSFDDGKGDEAAQKNAKVYSEAGAMTIGKNPASASAAAAAYENNVYDKILDRYGGKIFGFQRSERLDVKKPGPNYKVNNYAFRNINTQDQDKPKQDENEEKTLSNGFKRRVLKDVFSDTYPTFQNPSYEYVPGNYRHNPHVTKLRTSDQNQSPSYVTIETNHDLSESAVSQLVGKLTKLFNFPPGIFSQRKFHGNKIIFKIKQSLSNPLNPSATEIKRLIENSNTGDLADGIRIVNVYLDTPKDEYASTNLRSDGIEDSDQYAAVDVDYAYIRLKDPIRNKADGQRIVDQIEKMLRLPENTLYEVNTAVSQVMFKVKPNAQNLNASELARRIDLLKSRIKSDLKIDITSVGIVDKDKLPTATRLSHTDDSLYMLTFVVCGVIGAVLVSAVALYCTKKQSRLKDKLHKIVPSDKEFGKDYQDLCRTRMTRKSSQDAASTAATGGQRVTSLSRESDNSPSSRSSTSSWSEEPMTNMDITTGHMVLAYMEDHLNNKARLDTEWAALCAYDADPCSVAVAQLKENIRKNRYVNALPYDHARVILNALSNVNGSDYINASTITDHDPRNAAYIATQGPLENTVDDFWQMIWEQGCVVIVMLTRLVENDTSMCYRYWPMDGSHLYDIYEVHLVSEHIWCDDFLVRSFYLKNVKTTETRTVTQFHFLTWPEGGIPSATKPLLEFRRKVNKSFRGRSCPIVVHCSDGVGRTGSYLLLDMVLNRISKGAKEIDIAATLEHIRDQRAGAVCTKQQFQFVLSAVAEEVQAALRALPQQQSTQQQQQQQQQQQDQPASDNATVAAAATTTNTTTTTTTAVAAEATPASAPPTITSQDGAVNQMRVGVASENVAVDIEKTSSLPADGNLLN